MKISVVIPVYGCEDCLRELAQRLAATLKPLCDDYEIIMVDDCCPQQSWRTVAALAGEDPHVKGIRFSHNRGQHYAITAGLDHASGDWVVVMDCDLQDVPEEIASLYETTKQGYDLVIGQRIDRKDSFVKRTGSRLFYSVLTYLTDTQQDTSIANFGIYSSKVIAAIRQYREQNRLFPLFVKLVGFHGIKIPVQHAERGSGKSSYNFNRLLHLAIDAILAHSNKPLRLTVKFGFLVALSSTLYALYLVLRYLVEGTEVAGWTSVMVSMFIMFGLSFSMFGVIGLYVGKVFDEVKGRPLYIIDKTLNLDPPAN